MSRSDKIQTAALILAILVGLQNRFSQSPEFAIGEYKISVYLIVETGLLFSGILFLLYAIFSGLNQAKYRKISRGEWLEERLFGLGILSSFSAILISVFVQLSLFIAVKTPKFSYKTDLFATLIILGLFVLGIMIHTVTKK